MNRNLLIIVTTCIVRIRYGYVHVLNNFYEGWGMYAIGGSEEPTIVSQGNVFTAPNGVNKEVRFRTGSIDSRIRDEGVQLCQSSPNFVNLSSDVLIVELTDCR